ncbi:hypothetical protein Gocc_0401 [Gaiella occulta]|uniref:Flagellar FliJ protein n=1 Tax=Gaiella occulta TaxID=1002870 RepID=A0A7M2Z278_9ACTN|nr:hypothetical protein [Gaiella occulta]RDI75982.1 hypothetical protein Gocc_0401 [Gaiella occulta]
MKGFRFRLAPVQRLRRQEEEARQLALAQELSALERLRGAEAEQASFLAGLERQGSGTALVTIEQLALERASYEAGSRRLRGLRSSREEQEGAVGEARRALERVSVAREAIDRLGEAARARHERARAAAELAELDEISVQRHRP